MRLLVILFLVLILASLGSALFYVFKDRGQSKRAVKALALRVGLSIGLFLLLMIGFYTGIITHRL
jgi:FtsH-binding integral membrane protein